MTSPPNDSSSPEVTTQSEGDDLGFLNDLTSAPCFRQSTLYAIGGGGTIAAIRLIRNRDPIQAAETWVKAGCGIALLSWLACRRQFYAEREMTYGSLQKVRRNAALQAAARAKEMRDQEGESVVSADERQSKPE